MEKTTWLESNAAARNSDTARPVLTILEAQSLQKQLNLEAAERVADGYDDPDLDGDSRWD